MNTFVRRVNEIPIDIYIKIPSLIYNTWKIHFSEAKRYHNKLANRELQPHNTMALKLSNRTYYISKADNDPLDLEYIITFKSRLSKFKSVLTSAFSKYGINFDFDLFYDKDKLLLDIGNELSLIVGAHINVKYDPRYIMFTDNVLLMTKNDIIEL